METDYHQPGELIAHQVQLLKLLQDEGLSVHQTQLLKLSDLTAH